MGVMNKTSSIETTIIGTENNQRTYEIVKELKGDVKAKEDVILIQVFPTISPEDCTTSDVTTFHLVNKMKDLGWNPSPYSSVRKTSNLYTGISRASAIENKDSKERDVLVPVPSI